jgi:outer membrane protein
MPSKKMEAARTPSKTTTDPQHVRNPEVPGLRPAILLVGVLCGAGAQAEEAQDTSESVTLSRRFIIDTVSTKNPKVLSARAEKLRAEARMGQVRAARHPTLDMQVLVATALKAETVTPNSPQSTKSAYDFSFSDLSASFIGQVSLTQTLETFGKIDLRAEAAEESLRSAEFQADITRADILLYVLTLYETHLFAREGLLFAKEVEGYVERSIEETEDRLEDGATDVTVKDLLRLKTAKAVILLLSHRADAGIRQTEAGLRAYLGIDPSVRMVLQNDHQDPVIEDLPQLPELMALARRYRPELGALEHGVRALTRLADAEEADYYPNIFLYGFVSGAYTPGRQFQTSRYVFDPLGHVVPAALIGAKWSLEWDMASRRADEVRADAFKYQRLWDWAQVGIPAEVNKAYEDALRAKKNLDTSRQYIPFAKKWVIRAGADFGVGLDDARALVDAVQSYAVLKTSMLESVFELNVALAELAQVTGVLTAGTDNFYPGKESQ